MRILIFTASTGGGHKKAASALKETFQRLSPDSEISVLDGIALTGKIYNHFICDGYTLLAKKAPNFYGSLYRASDKESPLNRLCNDSNKFRSHKLLPAINRFKPDVIVSCHAFITTMLGQLKGEGKIKVPVISQITDYASHYTYIVKNIDHFIVCSDEMQQCLTTVYGLPKERVHPFGIPVLEKFTKKVDKNTAARKLELKENTPTVLFMAGSFGVNDVLNFYNEISHKEPQLQIIVITGNNKKLYDRFKDVVNDNTRLLMYVDNVDDYMHCSDIIVTKPGGLTVSESLNCALPMAIYNAFPGQEEDNANFLLKKGVAVILGENPDETVRSLIYNKDVLDMMKSNCKKLCKSNASEQIFYLIKSIVENDNK